MPWTITVLLLLLAGPPILGEQAVPDLDRTVPCNSVTGLWCDFVFWDTVSTMLYGWSTDNGEFWRRNP
jgi:hypothetical protein